MPDKILRCAIYIRVSTAEQAMHGKSLNAQLEYLTNYANEHNYQIVSTYADEGKSARKNLKNRKAIKELLESVKRDEVDVILFWKMDRWFRNVSDFYKVQDILDAHGTKWTAVAEPNMNMDTRDGRLNLNIMLSIGQNEVDTTAERIKFTAESIVSNGGLIFGERTMPLGYTKGMVNGKKAMVFDDEVHDMVRDAFGYLMKHQTKRATVFYIQKKYDCHFTYKMLDTMCHSEFYIGKYRNNNHYCPAYLTMDEYEKIQRINQRNIKKNRTDRIYLFSGLIICPFCGTKFGAYGGRPHLSVKTNEIKVYHYYRCYSQMNRTKPHDYHIQIGERTLERYLLDNLVHEYEKYLTRCTEILEKSNQKKAADPNKIMKRIERLNQLYIKGRIEESAYEKQYNEYQQEYQNALSDPKPITQNHSYLKHLTNSDFKSMYEALDKNNKQAFWRGIIDSIVLDKNKKVKEINFL